MRKGVADRMTGRRLAGWLDKAMGRREDAIVNGPGLSDHAGPLAIRS